jgi:ribosome-associated translation inhibitor RaiA
MIIEFHDTAREVQDWVIGYIRSKFMQLHKKHRQILRVQVNFKRSAETNDDGKICEITLTSNEGAITARGSAGSYEHAAREAIEEVTKKIDEEQTRKTGDLPDELPGAVIAG